MPTITEGMQSARRPPSASSQDYHDAPATPGASSINMSDAGGPAFRVATGASTLNEAGNAARRNRGLRRHQTGGSAAWYNDRTVAGEYDSEVVDLLDLVGKCTARPLHYFC